MIAFLAGLIVGMCIPLLIAGVAMTQSETKDQNL
jgi:hypothetical protein